MLKKYIPIMALLISSLAAATDTIVNVGDFYADPTDVVIFGTKPSTCNGSFYILPRSNTNFREAFDILLAAKLASRSVRIYYSTCQGDRAVVTHVSLLN